MLAISHKNHDGRYIRQTPPEKAMSALNAFVLFSVLASDLRPLRIPTMTARMMISPAEETANETFEMRFLSMDSRFACASVLFLGSITAPRRYVDRNFHLFSPDST